MKKTISMLAPLCVLSFLAVCGIHSVSLADDDVLPIIKVRINENYRQLLDQDADLPLWKQPFKGVPLIVGGDLRWRFSDISEPDYGFSPGSHNSMLLQRVYLFADLYLGKHHRIFVSGHSAHARNQEFGPSPVDENRGELDIITYQFYTEDFEVRIGKQEIKIGPERMFGLRNGTNVRINQMAVFSRWTMDDDNAFTFIAGAPIRHQIGAFDDFVNTAERYYRLGWDRGSREYSYLFYRDDTPIAGAETAYRHMLAVRTPFTFYDIPVSSEFFVQWGQSGETDILAWRAVTDWGVYQTPTWSVNLGIDVSSGGQSDDKIRTFDPMYMRGNMLSEIAAHNAANVLNIHPTASWQVNPRFSMGFELSFFRRMSNSDTLYDPPRFRKLATDAWSGNFVGTVASISGGYNIHGPWNFGVLYSRFMPSDGLQDADIPVSDYIEFTVGMRF